MGIETSINRTEFLRSTLAFAGISLLPVTTIFAQEKQQEKPAPLSLETVKEFVGASHGKFDRVKEMLEENHLLLHASYDWGGGDFETGLGAAAHMGRKDIAYFLLDHGARLDIFAAAMLGKLDVVRAALTAFPETINTPGPHGIPLIAHAKAGGEEALSVFEYLESLLQESK